MIPLEKLRRIRAVVLDIDGVLTDGRVGYDGERKIKFFNYRDGHWLKLAKRHGYIAGLISGRASEANRARAAELGLDFCLEDVHDKLTAFEGILEKYQLAPEQCLYVGDDLVDAPIMSRVGIAVAVADAVPALDEFADWRLKTPGGHGVFVEILEPLFRENGLWEKVMERYRK